jgi:hypothetical protein
MFAGSVACRAFSFVSKAGIYDQGSERQRRMPMVARIRQRTRNLIRAF